jgi:hypothetical protein
MDMKETPKRRITVTSSFNEISQISREIGCWRLVRREGVTPHQVKDTYRD